MRYSERIFLNAAVNSDPGLGVICHSEGIVDYGSRVTLPQAAAAGHGVLWPSSLTSW
jgi:hypothetical protein